MSDDLKQRIREIEESAKRVDKLASMLAWRTELRKTAKDELKAAAEKHMELCRAWKESAEVAERPLIKAVEAKADESWRDEPIEVLQAVGLDAGIIDSLRDHGVMSLGELDDRRDESSVILGFVEGEGDSVLVEEAMNRYWDARAADVQDADDDEDEADEFDRKEPVEPWPDVSDEPDEDERSGLDLVTSRPGSDPESNGVEVPKKAKRGRKAVR